MMFPGERGLPQKCHPNRPIPFYVHSGHTHKQTNRQTFIFHIPNDFLQATLIVSTVSAWQLFRAGSSVDCRRKLKENKDHSRVNGGGGGGTSATVSALVHMLRIQLYSSMAFSIVVFTCWTLGYAYMAGWRSPNVINISLTTSAVLGYLFAALNLLQGIYLFSYHCLRNDQVN